MIILWIIVLIFNLFGFIASRQIANLKQNLKHTTEQTMQLDTAIEGRKREIDNVAKDINNEKDNNENNG